MKKLLLLPLLLFAFTKSANAQIPSALQTRLDFVLDSVCTVYNIKGASAAVLIPQYGTNSWTGTYGESYSGVPIATDMHFGIGSNTKTFTAALMLKLQEDGLLSLDDTIGTWFPGVANVNGQITIRQMLNHTSGLYSFTNHPNFSPSINADVTAIWPPEDVLQFINAPLFAPGTDWSYSNTNYLLAGLIIKAVTGTEFHDALLDSILTPQGLNNTGLYPYHTPSGTIPHAWSKYFGQPYLVDGIDVGWEHTANFSMAGAAGAIMSTAEDNVKFWHQLMSGSIINNSSLDEMKQTISIGGGLGYGLGIFSRAFFNGHAVYSHGGTNVCWINENVYDDENGTCISVLTNQDSVTNTILLTKVVAALHKEVLFALDVPEMSNNAQIKVYPNPAHNDINILTEEPLTMQLTDISGKKVLRAKLKKGGNNIPLTGTSPGLYFIQLRNNNDQLVQAGKVSVY
jgi:D-alanyl-D-alanine carboxypeptidase